MRKFLAFFLLINHLNTSMLLPQVPETDVYDMHGQEVDDINSVFEYVMVYLGFDNYPDDEDNDSGQNFRVPSFAQYTIQLEGEPALKLKIYQSKPAYIIYNEGNLHNRSSEILVPPPEA